MRGRIRTFKPEVFDDEELWDLGDETGLPVFQCFLGLWSYADREGRFEWRPRALKKHILPYWAGDIEAVLEALASKLFIVRYTVNGKDYGYVRTLKEHQSFNSREPASELPAPDEHGRSTPHVHAYAEPARDTDAHRGNGNGTERNGNGEGTEPRAPDAPTIAVGDATTLHRAVAELTEPESHVRLPKGWSPSEAFYGEALSAGVTREFLDEDVAYWRGRKLGGEWFDLEQFFRAHFPRLAKRRETESFKASRRSDPDDRLQRQADRVKMLREQEAAEERRAAGGGA